jgi:Tannase-like family of unknown function (DUF6351)
MRRTIGRRAVAVLFTMSATSIGGVAVGADVASAAEPFVLTSVSNPHPDLVSGGDVLLRVAPPDRFTPDQVSIELNGRPVTSAFEQQPDGTFLGLVTGLRHGRNTISARGIGHGRGAPRGRSARLAVDDHPITGPVFSGPQQLPFFCETTAFGLDPASQPFCSAPSKVSYLYRNLSGQFVPLADPTQRPADIATVTVGAQTIPYIVRLEQGTIDRAVYEIAALYDGRAPDPLRLDYAGWNHKLVYTFGGGCNAGYHQGRGTGGVLNDLFLSRGYLVASSTLNVLDNNCSTIISAEAAMMVKEHAIETYGPVQHTIGWGGSGGAIQQYDIADQYPGIIDGIIPGVSFPDPYTTGGPVTDCRLLNHFFDGVGPMFTPAQRVAVEGFITEDVCRSWELTFANRSTATGSCDPAIPPAVRWDPVLRPNGVKCSGAEQVVNQLGRDPATGFVRNLYDNVGLQYGLRALLAGLITAEQFVTLNERVGGLDVAGNLSPQRSVADPLGLVAAYRTDLVNSGGQGLATTPVIDQRTYLDPFRINDIHTTEWSFVMRARMQRQSTAANQVIIENSALDPAAAAAAAAFELDGMDRWLAAIEADATAASPAQKVARNRPADVTDGCFLPGTTTLHQETLTYPDPPGSGSGVCSTAFRVFANTRLAATEPLTRDWLKCRLKPLDFTAYPVTFTPAQQARLQAAFRQGVCDFTKPGVGQQRPAGPWLEY